MYSRESLESKELRLDCTVVLVFHGMSWTLILIDISSAAQAPMMAATNFQSLIRVALFSFLCAFDINRRIQIAPRLPNDVRGNALGFCNGILSHRVAVLFQPRAAKLNLTTSAGSTRRRVHLTSLPSVALRL